MVSTYSSRLRFNEQGTGDNNNTWGSVLNNSMIQLADDAIAGYTAVTVDASGITLTTNNGLTDQARMPLLKVVGTMTTSINVVVPNLSQNRWIYNGTTGSFTLGVKTQSGGGSTISIPQGQALFVICDGTNIVAGSLPIDPTTVSALGTAAFRNIGSTSIAVPDVSIANTLYLRAGVSQTVSAPIQFAAQTDFVASIFVSAPSAFTKQIIVSGAKAVSTFTTLTDGPVVTCDMATGNNFVVTIGGSRSLLVQNLTAAQGGVIYIFQDATGNRTLALDSNMWKFPGGTQPTLTSTASAVDILTYSNRTVSIIDGNMLNNMS